MRRGWPSGLAALLASVAAAPAPAPAPAPLDPALATLLRAPTRCTRPGHPDEVIVCGNGRNREAERQRLPLPTAPDDGDPHQFSVSRERNALVERTTGVAPCNSPVGPSGEYGCLARDTERAHQQHPGGMIPTPHPLRSEPDEDVPPK